MAWGVSRNFDAASMRAFLQWRGDPASPFLALRAAPCPLRAPVVRRGFWWRHALFVPALLALGALVCKGSGLDYALAHSVFDGASQQFWGRESTALELIGHRIAKSAVFAAWFAVFAGALAATWVPRLRAHRALLWATAFAMASGPLLVMALKPLNSIHCPWDLKEYGGVADRAAGWFVAAQDAGRCFPGGHAAGGFSLVALFFAGAVTRQRHLQTMGLLLALGAGTAFSVVRMLQGAHFASHNLWAAAIDWSAAAAVFALFWARVERVGAWPDCGATSCP